MKIHSAIHFGLLVGMALLALAPLPALGQAVSEFLCFLL